MLKNTELDALDRQVSFFDSLELLLQNELDSRRNNKIDRLIKKDNFKGYVCIEELEAVDTEEYIPELSISLLPKIP